jgi:hypothetical protein
MTAIDLQKEGTEKKNKEEMNYAARKTCVAPLDPISRQLPRGWKIRDVTGVLGIAERPNHAKRLRLEPLESDDHLVGRLIPRQL